MASPIPDLDFGREVFKLHKKGLTFAQIGKLTDKHASNAYRSYKRIINLSPKRQKA